MAKKEKKEKRREIKLTFEQLLAIYQQQRALIDSLTNQESMIRSIIAELQSTQDALSEIKKVGKDTNILVSLGSGVFASARLSDASEVKVEIGGNVFEQMPIAKALNKLEERKANLEKRLKNIGERKKQAIAFVIQLERLINEAQRKAREKVQGVA